LIQITPDYPGIGNLPKGKLPGSIPPKAGNAPPLPLGSNSAGGGTPSGAGDYCPGILERPISVSIKLIF